MQCGYQSFAGGQLVAEFLSRGQRAIDVRKGVLNGGFVVVQRRFLRRAGLRYPPEMPPPVKIGPVIVPA